MKKVTLVIMLLLAFAFTMKAQQYVSTEPANRNVIIEEFTGRNCGYCPDGHLIANNIMAEHPGRAWAINVHSGGYAPTTYPNFNTAVSATILSGFPVSGFPAGVVNRSTANGQGRGAWAGLANTEFNQAAVCNVAGKVMINPETRMASVTVEVYYTGNSGYDQNYLTVAMLQDSIMGSQSGMSGNPAQVVNGTYCHMHVLRDIIQTSAWGDPISPTTQGTLITKTYQYQIPEVIGDPNGVNVILDHIFFLAWVSERVQGTPTRPILNACELDKVLMTTEPIYPSVSDLAQHETASCSQVKDFSFNVTNIGTQTLSSLDYSVQVADVEQSFEWKGTLAPGDRTKVDFSMEIPFGDYMATLSITEANGEPYSSTKSFAVNSHEWGEVNVEGETTNLKVYIIQDQYGEQITWNIINSVGEVVAEGGPYDHLLGSGSTKVNVANVTVPSNDCYLFRIYDSNGNGICCTYGNGTYYIKDEHGNRIVDGDGAFGESASHLFSINSSTAVEDHGNLFRIYPNPASTVLNIEGVEMSHVEIYNALGQCVMTEKVNGDKTRVNSATLNDGLYFIRIYTKEGTVTNQSFVVAR